MLVLKCLFFSNLPNSKLSSLWPVILQKWKGTTSWTIWKLGRQVITLSQLAGMSREYLDLPPRFLIGWVPREENGGGGCPSWPAPGFLIVQEAVPFLLTCKASGHREVFKILLLLARLAKTSLWPAVSEGCTVSGLGMTAVVKNNLVCKNLSWPQTSMKCSDSVLHASLGWHPKWQPVKPYLCRCFHPDLYYSSVISLNHVTSSLLLALVEVSSTTWCWCPHTHSEDINIITVHCTD